MSGFTKLDSEILTSTIWGESMGVRLVWITMLAMCDKNGEVHASIPGLARAAVVPLEDCEEAIRKFLDPDPYSRSKEYAGRRIAEIDGGWVLLNHQKYKLKYSEEWKRELDAKRQHRKRERDKSRDSHGMSREDRDGSRHVANSREKLPIQIPDTDTDADTENRVVVTPPIQRDSASPKKCDAPTPEKLPTAGSDPPGSSAAVVPAPANGEGENSSPTAVTPSPRTPTKQQRKDADSPLGRCFAHWRDVIWPQMSNQPYLDSAKDFVQLANALKKISETQLKSALELAVNDPFWRGKPLCQVSAPSALNQLLAQSSPALPTPKSPIKKSGVAEWDKIISAANMNGSREAVKWLSKYVSPLVNNSGLILRVRGIPERDYVEKHISWIRDMAKGQFQMQVQVQVQEQIGTRKQKQSLMNSGIPLNRTERYLRGTILVEPTVLDQEGICVEPGGAWGH